MKNLNDNFPDLKIELMTEGENDGPILLEQSNDGNVDRVGLVIRNQCGQYQNQPIFCNSKDKAA